MKEVSWIDPSWSLAFDFLVKGKCVFLSAPDYYGIDEFADFVNQSPQLLGLYTTLEISAVKDSDTIDFQHILDDFHERLKCAPAKLSVDNKFDFIEAVEAAAMQQPFLILVRNNFRSCRNVAVLIDAFHDIIRKHLNRHYKPLTVMLLDDYSMYFYETERTSNGEASAWPFFLRLRLSPLRDAAVLDQIILNFFHNPVLTKRISSALMAISGGHQGIILETVDYLLEHWSSIDFDLIEKELQGIVGKTRSIGAISLACSTLSVEELEQISSFRRKKLFKSNEGDFMRLFFKRGILVKEGEAYIQMISGAIRTLFENIKNSKLMGTQKKLVLCIHGLGGSEQTWARFREIYSQDSDVREEYDFATYEYPTSPKWNFNFIKARVPAIKQLADGVAAEVLYRYSDYPEVVLVCHSLGGLVGRKFLLDRYLESKSTASATGPLLKRIIMFATPHNGARLADLGKYLAVRNKQVWQLARNSEFIEELNNSWMLTGAHEHYKGLFVVGGVDQIVDYRSAAMLWGNNKSRMVIGADHFNIIKPEHDKALPYLIFRKTLLEDV